MSVSCLVGWFDLVAAVFGEMSNFSRIVYAVVGLAAIVLAVVSFLKPQEQV